MNDYLQKVLTSQKTKNNGKFDIIIPKGVRYIGEDWGTDDRYKLEYFPFPHILNKVLTGCGFTEYCIRNDQNVILCSPRRMLLENKKNQHPESNVYYAKNELETIVNYEKTFTLAEGRKEVNKKYTSILYSKPKPQPTKEEIEEQKQRILEYKNKVQEHYYNCGGMFGKGCKILVTYDSFRHVKEALAEIGVLDQFQVVVDEFQSVLVDVKFKSSTELELLHQLSGIDKVCYVSATPMLDKYLKKLDEFKNLPYFQFDWASEDPSRIIKPNLNVHRSESITSDIVGVVHTYKEGKFEKDCNRDYLGNIVEIESREAVFYINSVRLLCSIITKCELIPDQCNILCARTKENEQKVRRAFNEVIGRLGKGKKLGSKDSVIGKVPTKGQPHKMFTFCTRTVYLGADFYSTNARTFIFCDSNIDCLSVDISMDLPQILGRQRLKENPWKNSAELYIKSTILKLTKEDFDENVKEKIDATNKLLGIYSKSDLGEQHVLSEKYERDALSNCYKYDYVAVNRHAGKVLVPVFNQLMLVSEERAFDIQQLDYADRVSIFNTLHDKGFITTDVDKELDAFNKLPRYQDKMEFVCYLGYYSTDRMEDSKFILFLNSIPKSFKNYYLILGPVKCKAMAYKKSELEKEYQRQLNNQGVSMDDRIYDTFHAGERWKKSEIKEKLGKIYADSGYEGTAKAVDIERWFTTRPTQFLNKETKKRDAGFELLKRINKK